MKHNAFFANEILSKISEVDAVANSLPCVIIIHNIRTSDVEYMSPLGLELLGGLSLEEIKDMGAEYHNRYFNSEESKEYVPKIFGLLERNNTDESLTFFQQVRMGKEGTWQWYCTTIKIFMRDDEGLALLTIAVSLAIDFNDNMTIKADRLLKENNFLRQNNFKFQQLSKREKELLKDFASGRSTPEIAKKLHLSIHTIDTHRRNIKRKLGVNSVIEMAEFARAFDII